MSRLIDVDGSKEVVHMNTVWDLFDEFVDVDMQLTVKAIPLDRIKKAREEIDDLDRYFDNDLYTDNTDSMFKCSEVLEILDKLIAESE